MKNTAEAIPMESRAETTGAMLTVEQFAERVNLTPATIRRWLLMRRITWCKVGGAVRIPEAEATRLIAEGLRPRRVS